MALKLGLRPALLLALVPVLLLPWVGLRFIGQMAELTRDERRESLAGAARSYAASLHERSDLFSPANETALPANASPLTVAKLSNISTDGQIGEWFDAATVSLPVSTLGEAPDTTLKIDVAAARLPVGEDQDFFLMLNAIDERYVPVREAAAQSDPLPGDSVLVWVGAHPDEMLSLSAPLIETRTGWVSEFKVPDTTRFVRFRVRDVDYQARRVTEATADSGLLILVGNAQEVNSLKALRVKRRQEQWNAAISGIDRTGLRVAVYDAGGNLLALRGDFTKLTTQPKGVVAKAARGLLSWAVGVGADVADRVPTQPPVSQALNGLSGGSSRRVVEPGKAPFWVTASAQPIWVQDKIAGALLLEQGSASDLATGQSALEWMALLAAGAILATLLALFGIGSLTVARVRRLKQAAQNAIDARGRVVGAMPQFKLRDEISELSDGYDDVLSRLREHQRYLANLRSRLVHELRTPIMVVRSSLENLADHRDQHVELTKDEQYIDRALGGATRLEKIVANMSEAASLETMLNESQLEQVDIGELLTGLTQAYNGAYQSSTSTPRFEFEGQLNRKEDAIAMVVPESIAQAVDKLAANAVDFAPIDSTIRVELFAVSGGLSISLHNVGSSLPDVMTDRLFESMVSVRTDRASEQSHLGLGLYLVRLISEFHGGSPFAENAQGGVRIGFTISASLEDHENGES